MRWHLTALAVSIALYSLGVLGGWFAHSPSEPSYDHVYSVCVQHSPSDFCVDFAADSVAYGLATAPNGGK